MFKKLAMFICLIGIVLTFAGCSITANNITLNKTDLEVENGQTFYLIASISPTKAQQAIVWSIEQAENTTIELLNNSNSNAVQEFKAIAHGTNVVKAETENGLTAYCSVTVVESSAEKAVREKIELEAQHAAEKAKLEAQLATEKANKQNTQNSSSPTTQNGYTFLATATLSNGKTYKVWCVSSEYNVVETQILATGQSFSQWAQNYYNYRINDGYEPHRLRLPDDVNNLVVSYNKTNHNLIHSGTF